MIKITRPVNSRRGKNLCGQDSLNQDIHRDTNIKAYNYSKKKAFAIPRYISYSRTLAWNRKSTILTFDDVKT